MLIDLKNAPDWAISREPINTYPYAGGLVSVRFDGQTGEFYVGSDSVGKEIDILPFGFEWDTGERFGRGRQSWLDVAFIYQGLPSCISLKKESAVNIFATFAELAGEAIDFTATKLTLEAVEQVVRYERNPEETEIGTFWVVKVKDCQFAEEEHFIRISVFLETIPWSYTIVGEI